MYARVLTEVSATVAAEREPELVERFGRLVAEEVPDGLLRTELLRGPEHQWRIQTLWRDRDALVAMRARGEPPAAPALFSALGAEPALAVLEVEVAHVPGSDQG